MTVRQPLQGRTGKHMTDIPRPRVIVITGASAGVGRAAAHAFAREGAHIGLIARSREALQEAAREVTTFGGKALVLPCDVADAGGMEAAAAAVEERF